jgi:hypothetical protein
MTELLNSATEQAARVFIVSNSPYYFYRHMRELPVVRALSNHVSIMHLESCLHELKEGGNTDQMQVAMKCYALAFAILIADGDRQAVSALVQHSSLPWAESVASMVRAESIASNRIVVDGSRWATMIQPQRLIAPIATSMGTIKMSDGV